MTHSQKILVTSSLAFVTAIVLLQTVVLRLDPSALLLLSCPYSGVVIGFSPALQQSDSAGLFVVLLMLSGEVLLYALIIYRARLRGRLLLALVCLVLAHCAALASVHFLTLRLIFSKPM